MTRSDGIVIILLKHFQRHSLVAIQDIVQFLAEKRNMQMYTAVLIEIF
jgi:hypothetical protein